MRNWKMSHPTKANNSKKSVMVMSRMIANAELARWIITGEGAPIVRLEEYREQRMTNNYKISDQQQRKRGMKVASCRG